MTTAHSSPACEAPWEWRLAAHTATAIAAAATPRWLEVTAGRVWLTGGEPGVQAVDVWLAAGQRHALPAGTAWLLEGWPQARVAVLEAHGGAARRSGAATAVGRLLRRLVASWRRLEAGTAMRPAVH